MIHFTFRTLHGDKIACAVPEGALVFKVTTALQARFGHNVTLTQFISAADWAAEQNRITLSKQETE